MRLSLSAPAIHAEARGRGGIEIVHDSLQAFLHRPRAEVEQKTNLQIREPEIGEKLFRVDGRKSFHRLQLDDQPLVHEQVDVEGIVESQTVEREADRVLPIDAQSTPAAGT